MRSFSSREDQGANRILASPSDWPSAALALMLTGFGAIGAAMRRRPLALVGSQVR